MIDRMTHVSLFTGIGGLDLAAEWAGFETILQVERDPYCLRVLEKRWPGVKRITDIREVKADAVNRPVTVISGGFPCQPHSLAGKRKRENDDRYLWPEMHRVISEIKPCWAVIENVRGILSDGTAIKVMDEMADIGYWTEAFCIPAYAYGANFSGIRVFLVASSNCEYGKTGVGIFKNGANEISQGNGIESIENLRIQAASRGSRGGNGVPHYVDRLRALGNAVVPQQAYPIFQAIAAVVSRFER